MKTLGFTGTQKGTTLKQRMTLRELVQSFHPEEVHHGDCVGADSEFHQISLEDSWAQIHIHPPIDQSKRAFCNLRTPEDRLVLYPTLYYLQRNKNIVLATGYLIACPKQFEEIVRSGTWSTIREARRQNRVISIIFPDGTTKNEAGEGEIHL